MDFTGFEVGRFEPEPISTQTQMENVVAYLSEKDRERFQSPSSDSEYWKKDFLPIGEWEGISFNAKGEVVKIIWDKLFQEKGKIDFSWLPPTLETFSARHCSLVGSVSFGFFPSQIRQFSVRGNNLSGKVNFSDLPHLFETLDLAGNNFKGGAQSAETPQLPTISVPK